MKSFATAVKSKNLSRSFNIIIIYNNILTLLSLSVSTVFPCFSVWFVLNVPLYKLSIGFGSHLTLAVNK